MNKILQHIKFLTLVMTLALCHTTSYAQNKVIVSKKHLTLYVVNAKNDTIFTAPVCIGKNRGDKQEIGDSRTPEGTFPIHKILDSRDWKHDFNDGAGVRRGAYGPYFLRLKMEKYKDIGIHGTCFPESMGKRDSEGCVRLRNEDITRLFRLVRIGTLVTILPEDK